MLTISQISKSFGGRTLFEDVTLQVNREDRIGLVGPNGAGKSTLFSLILQTESPDDGQITFQRNVTVGFLPQESAPAGDETVLELATAITPEIVKLQKLIKAWDSDHPTEVEHHDDAHARFDELGGYQLESKAKQILSGLSFREKDFNRPAREMSGGWVMRAHLARLLVQEPDLLMLDEPTNHLDLEALLWFQEYLQGYPGAILMISHDREFLNQLVSSIVEIRQSQIFQYRGNYEDYLVQREANEERLLTAYKNQQKEIAHLMEFVERFRAKASKAAQAQSKLKQIERMEKLEAPESENKKISFTFPQPQRSGLKVITLEAVHHAYGDNVVYSGIDFQAERGQRTVLVGPNGAGKSTLLKILAGAFPLQGGTRELGHNVKAGYYSQYRVEMLEPRRTVLEEALDTPQRITEQSVRTLLGCFLFRGDDVFKKVSVLSGGEKSRLALVKLLLDPPNLLLMDEPTTHLDIPSIDALIEALKQFSGTVIFISHDVYFIRALANHVVHVNAGRLTHYAGDYQYYLDKTKATSAREALTAGAKVEVVRQDPTEKASFKTKEQKRQEAEERQARSRERKDHQQLVHKLEKEIHALEQKQVELTAELEKPETYQTAGRAMEINRELVHVQDKLAELTPKWEQASLKLEASA
ncbi:ABC-F family ATP-binding cassette domain-containing protein [Pedosphaera parvula]|uniref:ABC transporter related-protein n=1 Tax=Pedosphaera parvula (strain Ellin514) TaxID=320771 RepID=B9XSR8_PEDPL|nr:ABC-F family ATP-binding cassette domain-containing protein [Pedosphaera parvula]EEF57120.1 ABC transporter related-protein [Pedosphaera parvula Ellin514]